jgi:hypothetical protein
MPSPADLLEFVESKPEGPFKLATVLSDNVRQFEALNRYERRALSRRKVAIQALDAERRMTAKSYGLSDGTSLAVFSGMG